VEATSVLHQEIVRVEGDGSYERLELLRGEFLRALAGVVSSGFSEAAWRGALGLRGRLRGRRPSAFGAGCAAGAPSSAKFTRAPGQSRADMQTAERVRRMFFKIWVPGCR